MIIELTVQSVYRSHLHSTGRQQAVPYRILRHLGDSVGLYERAWYAMFEVIGSQDADNLEHLICALPRDAILRAEVQHDRDILRNQDIYRIRITTPHGSAPGAISLDLAALEARVVATPLQYLSEQRLAQIREEKSPAPPPPPKPTGRRMRYRK